MSRFQCNYNNVFEITAQTNDNLQNNRLKHASRYLKLMYFNKYIIEITTDTNNNKCDFKLIQLRQRKKIVIIFTMQVNLAFTTTKSLKH